MRREEEKGAARIQRSAGAAWRPREQVTRPCPPSTVTHTALHPCSHTHTLQLYLGVAPRVACVVAACARGAEGGVAGAAREKAERNAPEKKSRAEFRVEWFPGGGTGAAAAGQEGGMRATSGLARPSPPGTT